jgi:hypothetical protein
MDSFFGQPDCLYRMRCAVKATAHAAKMKRPSHPMCSTCPFIPYLLELEAQRAVRLSRNIDVILTQSDDSTEDS